MRRIFFENDQIHNVLLYYFAIPSVIIQLNYLLCRPVVINNEKKWCEVVSNIHFVGWKLNNTVFQDCIRKQYQRQILENTKKTRTNIYCGSPIYIILVFWPIHKFLSFPVLTLFIIVRHRTSIIEVYTKNLSGRIVQRALDKLILSDESNESIQLSTQQNSELVKLYWGKAETQFIHRKMK